MTASVFSAKSAAKSADSLATDSCDLFAAASVIVTDGDWRGLTGSAIGSTKRLAMDLFAKMSVVWC